MVGGLPLLSQLWDQMRDFPDSSLTNPLTTMCYGLHLAEGEGLKPSKALALPVFKTGAFNRSATPPIGVEHYTIEAWG